jgi:hypothetical protein
VEQVNPSLLLNNSLLREHGQLVNLKLARVVSVFEPQAYLYSKIKRRQCSCKLSQEVILERNHNMLKIFKNQVNYSTKMGKNLYYDVLEESKDSFCSHCNVKYLVTDSKFAPC